LRTDEFARTGQASRADPVLSGEVGDDHARRDQLGSTVSTYRLLAGELIPDLGPFQQTGPNIRDQCYT